MSEKNHTPLPWSIYVQECATKSDASAELVYQVENTEPFVGKVFLLEAGGKCPAETGCGPTSEANAAFIVTACNSHYELLDALKEMSAAVFGTSLGDEPDVYKDSDRLSSLCALVRAAIAKAEGKA